MTHVTLIGASLRLERCKETTKDHVGSAMGAIYIYNIEAGNLLIDKNEGKQSTPSRPAGCMSEGPARARVPLLTATRAPGLASCVIRGKNAFIRGPLALQYSSTWLAQRRADAAVRLSSYWLASSPSCLADYARVQGSKC
jgi:hypothetical protein